MQREGKLNGVFLCLWIASTEDDCNYKSIIATVLIWLRSIVWIQFKKSIDIAKIFNEKPNYGQSINKSNKTEQNNLNFE